MILRFEIYNKLFKKMSNFELFETALNEFNKINDTSGYCNNDSDDEDLKGEKINYDSCSHANVFNDNGIISCLDCGNLDIDFSKFG